MRIPSLAGGHKLKEKLLIKVMGLMLGGSAPDVVKTLLYRRDFWGDPYNAVLELAMRGPSCFSIGERELLAAFVSNLNRCHF